MSLTSTSVQPSHYLIPPNSDFPPVPMASTDSSPPQQQRYPCPVCGNTFTRPQHVVRHLRSHTGERCVLSPGLTSTISSLSRKTDRTSVKNAEMHSQEGEAPIGSASWRAVLWGRNLMLMPTPLPSLSSLSGSSDLLSRHVNKCHPALAQSGPPLSGRHPKRRACEHCAHTGSRCDNSSPCGSYLFSLPVKLSAINPSFPNSFMC